MSEKVAKRFRRKMYDAGIPADRKDVDWWYRFLLSLTPRELDRLNTHGGSRTTRLYLDTGRTRGKNPRRDWRAQLHAVGVWEMPEGLETLEPDPATWVAPATAYDQLSEALARQGF